MKKLISNLLIILVSLSASAQVTTFVSGKYNAPEYNKWEEVTLTIKNFDSSKLSEKKISIESKFEEDGSFSFSTVEIFNPNTIAILDFPGSRETKIYLLPGDSLVGEFNKENFRGTIIYTGLGSGKNNYLNQRFLRFEEHKPNAYSYGREPKAYIEKLNDYKAKVLLQLEDFFQAGVIDSSFKVNEASRIEYQYLKDLLSSSLSNVYVYSEVKDPITEILKAVDCNDDNALLTIDEYRSFIKLYVHFQTFLEKADKNEVPGKLEFAKENLVNQTKRYYLVSLYQKTQNISYRLASEKEIILDYIIRNSDDPEFKNIIKEYHADEQTRRIRFSRDLGEVGSILATILVSFALFIFLFIKLIQWTRAAKLRINYAAWLRFVLLLFIVVACVGYISDTFHRYHILSVLFVSLMLVFLAIQNYLLIPRVFSKNRFISYGFLVLFFSAVYINLQLKIVAAMVQMYPFSYGNYQGGINRDVIGFIYGSVLILSLLSFLYHYITLLARKRKGFSYLFREKIVSSEALIHVIVFSLISIPLIDNVGRPLGISYLILFLLGAAIFYLQAFFLIPNYLLKKRIAHYFLYNAVVLIALLIVLFFAETLQSFINIRDKGIPVSFVKLFDIGRTTDIPLALASLWLIVPAGIYALVRKQIIDQKELGFTLFRKKEAELNQLRSQVNPHFLFNTLNTLYAFALKEKSEQTAECIAKLANLMRFLIDDMDKDEIAVKTEVGYIEDFIALQSIRSAVKHKIEINVAISEDAEYTIAPMLLIPFIENAFKHGMNPNKKSEFKFDVKAENQQMQFVIENSVDKNFEAFYKEKGFGIGIENVRKRLELIYAGKHNLSIADTNNRFIVILTIQLSNK